MSTAPPLQEKAIGKERFVGVPLFFRRDRADSKLHASSYFDT